jgi:glycosyl hydrolase
MDDIAYVDPLSTMHGIWEGTDADGQTWTLSVGGQDAVKDAWVRLSGKTVTSWYGEPECERYGTIGMILKDGTQADYFVVLNKDCVWGDSGLIGNGSMTICKADLDEEPIILSRQEDVDGDRDWSDAGGVEDIGQATWAENPDSSFDAAFGVDAEDTDAGTGSQSNDEESWDEGADAGWLHSESEAEASVEGTKIRYQMIVEDAALGSRFYGLIKSTDGGAHWQVVSSDPFGGQMGGSVEFTFLDEMFGFATLSHNGGDAAVLYVTEDGGKHYEQVEFAHKTYTDSIGNIVAPYDYPKMPYEKDGVIYVLCGQGADGDYDGGDSLHLARYRSEDYGHSFVFDTLVDGTSEG